MTHCSAVRSTYVSKVNRLFCGTPGSLRGGGVTDATNLVGADSKIAKAARRAVDQSRGPRQGFQTRGVHEFDVRKRDDRGLLWRMLGHFLVDGGWLLIDHRNALLRVVHLCCCGEEWWVVIIGVGGLFWFGLWRIVGWDGRGGK
jgi:hypothetical protein